MKKKLPNLQAKRFFAMACLLFLFGAIAWAQKTVTGTVLDTSGEPIIGANVVINGTTQGVTTDIDGNFSLTGVAESAVLHVTFIGYAAQDVAVKGQTKLSITLSEEQDLLDEVVVVGYGVQKKRDLTGAIASVKTQEITINPSSNPMEALQGKVAGLDITKTSGQAGSGVNMQLRGNRSIPKSSDDGSISNSDILSYSTQPLFIIDGLPGDYSTLNPNDIESIEVLKDASSTAIYGSDGANGVVIIMTKSAQEGKTQVNFNAYLGVNGWATTPKMMNAQQYVAAMRKAKEAAGTFVDEENMLRSISDATYTAYMNGQSIDWADELLQTGITQNYSLSVAGGTERTKGYLSFNFSDEKGQYANDDYKVYSTASRLDFKVNKFVNIGANIQGSYTHKNSPFAKLGDVVAKSPIGSTTDENGNLVTYINDDTSYINPLINNRSNYRSLGQNFKLYVNPYIRISPMKGLTWESRANATLTYTKSNKFVGEGSYDFYKNGANKDLNTSAQIRDAKNYNYTWENIVTWNRTFDKVHDVTVTGVQSWKHKRYEYEEANGTGIKSNKYLWHNIGASETTTSTSSYNMQKEMAYIARANYSYKGTYLFSASMRWDAKSVLAPGHRWASFPGVSAGWRISDENFMEPTEDWLDNLKVRISYGEAGGADMSPYMSINTLEQGHYTLGGEYITTYNYTQNVANKELTWERSKSWNYGIDANFLHNRINLNVDFYNTNTEGVIWQKNLPVSMGAYSASKTYSTYVNLAETLNRGIEISLNTVNFAKKDFTWNSTFTYAYNHEEIKKLSGTENDQVINGYFVYKVGSAIKSFYGFKTDGIWQESEADEAAIFGKKAGDIRISVPGLSRHTDSDGSIYYTDQSGTRYDKSNTWAIGANTNNQQVLGHNSPDWSLGFKNDFTYKWFDLSIYMYMRWGQMINYNMLTNYDTTVGRNFAASYLDHIGSYFPALNSNNPTNNMTEFSSLAFVDGSFFKVKNITLGYTMPKSLLKKAHIEKCRLYGTITNPITVAKSDLLEDYDPEMNGSSDYPLTKQLVFGINMTF
ncbi:MAG: TonB-dependent receptor [Bacteroidales bacterium]|jgi:TonB-linked SusC/RagA family outer membrane protein|nr:TonB-dependent receptor [Bacteroidales bacterium]